MSNGTVTIESVKELNKKLSEETGKLKGSLDKNNTNELASGIQYVNEGIRAVINQFEKFIGSRYGGSGNETFLCNEVEMGVYGFKCQTSLRKKLQLPKLSLDINATKSGFKALDPIMHAEQKIWENMSLFATIKCSLSEEINIAQTDVNQKDNRIESVEQEVVFSNNQTASIVFDKDGKIYFLDSSNQKKEITNFATLGDEAALKKAIGIHEAPAPAPEAQPATPTPTTAVQPSAAPVAPPGVTVALDSMVSKTSKVTNKTINETPIIKITRATANAPREISNLLMQEPEGLSMKPSLPGLPYYPETTSQTPIKRNKKFVMPSAQPESSTEEPAQKMPLEKPKEKFDKASIMRMINQITNSVSVDDFKAALQDEKINFDPLVALKEITNSKIYDGTSEWELIEAYMQRILGKNPTYHDQWMFVHQIQIADGQKIDDVIRKLLDNMTSRKAVQQFIESDEYKEMKRLGNESLQKILAKKKALLPTDMQEDYIDKLQKGELPEPEIKSGPNPLELPEKFTSWDEYYFTPKRKEGFGLTDKYLESLGYTQEQIAAKHEALKKLPRSGVDRGTLWRWLDLNIAVDPFIIGETDDGYEVTFIRRKKNPDKLAFTGGFLETYQHEDPQSGSSREGSEELVGVERGKTADEQKLAELAEVEDILEKSIAGMRKPLEVINDPRITQFAQIQSIPVFHLLSKEQGKVLHKFKGGPEGEIVRVKLDKKLLNEAFYANHIEILKDNLKELYERLKEDKAYSNFIEYLKKEFPEIINPPEPPPIPPVGPSKAPTTDIPKQYTLHADTSLSDSKKSEFLAAINDHKIRKLTKTNIESALREVHGDISQLVSRNGILGNIASKAKKALDIKGGKSSENAQVIQLVGSVEIEGETIQRLADKITQKNPEDKDLVLPAGSITEILEAGELGNKVKEMNARDQDDTVPMASLVEPPPHIPEAELVTLSPLGTPLAETYTNVIQEAANPTEAPAATLGRETQGEGTLAATSDALSAIENDSSEQVLPPTLELPDELFSTQFVSSTENALESEWKFEKSFEKNCQLLEGITKKYHLLLNKGLSHKKGSHIERDYLVNNRAVRVDSEGFYSQGKYCDTNIKKEVKEFIYTLLTTRTTDTAVAGELPGDIGSTPNKTLQPLPEATMSHIETLNKNHKVSIPKPPQQAGANSLPILPENQIYEPINETDLLSEAPITGISNIQPTENEDVEEPELTLAGEVRLKESLTSLLEILKQQEMIIDWRADFENTGTENVPVYEECVYMQTPLSKWIQNVVENKILHASVPTIESKILEQSIDDDSLINFLKKENEILANAKAFFNKFSLFKIIDIDPAKSYRPRQSLIMTLDFQGQTYQISIEPKKIIFIEPSHIALPILNTIPFINDEKSCKEYLDKLFPRNKAA